MTALAAGIDYIDLQFLGKPEIIATAVVHGPRGLALIDPGPSTTLENLTRALRHKGFDVGDITQLLLTHIHLDHAGAAGAIVERVPAVKVYVHDVGAPHMIDPARLLASATRLHGDQMETLWGPFLPLPASSVRSLAGGERLDVAGTSIRVVYTPGHAKHHVCYLDEATGMAYVGDTGGVRLGGDFLLVPTPPPDIDLEAWHVSVDAIEEWRPVSLFLTHFGPVTPARAHLARVHERLDAARAAIEASLKDGRTDEERVHAFVTRLRQEARRTLPEHEAAAAELAAPFDQLWQGLARYAKKKREAR